MRPVNILNPPKRICSVCGSEFADTKDHSCTDIENFYPICPRCKRKKENRGKSSLEIVNDYKKS